MSFHDVVQTMDEALLVQARSLPGWAIQVFFVLTKTGDGWALLLVLPLLFVRRARAFALGLASAMIVQSAVVSLLKWVLGRPRPCDALAWSAAVIIPCPHGPSFPSGHAAGAFTFAIFVAVWVRAFRSRAGLLWVLAVVYAALVAWSRCVLGVHYPSDVVAGAVLGATVGVATARYFGPNTKPLSCVDS